MCQLATILLTLTDAACSFSFIKQSCRKTYPHGRGKDVTVFQKGSIIGLHQAKKSLEEIAGIPGAGLKTVQRTVKTWNESGEPSPLRKKCSRKTSKILNDRDRRCFKRLVKSHRKKKKNSITHGYV